MENTTLGSVGNGERSADLADGLTTHSCIPAIAGAAHVGTNFGEAGATAQFASPAGKQASL